MPRSSKLGRMMEQEQLDAAQAMSPSERVQLAFELGRRDLEIYMAATGLDRAAAYGELARASRNGRQYSRCVEELS